MSDVNRHKFQTVKVQKKSGFDKSHRNLLTTTVGTLTPILCDELIPNTTFHLASAINACLPPLASDTFMSCDLKVEAFFVPTRLLYKGFPDWITDNKVYNQSGQLRAVNTPALGLTSAKVASTFGPGTLGDYLGIKLTDADVTALTADSSAHTIRLTPYPFLAYHKVYDDWYRNAQVQSPIFRDAYSRSDTANDYAINLPFTTHLSANTTSGSTVLYDTPTFPDGKSIYDLRQRNFGIDYFTSATPSAQAGAAQSVSLPVSGSTATMTISALRAANSLQMFLERNNISGPRYVDWLKANYNANLSDGVAQRTLFLGSTTINVYSKGVTTTGGDISSVSTGNPFITIGAEYGQASCTGNGTLVDTFTTQEHGYLLVLCSLVPKVTYGSGIDRKFNHFTVAGSQTDMANALLQNTGNQPIFSGELNATDMVIQPASVFGYTDKYAEYMTMEDELHGLVRDGESLQSFAAQRNFTNGQATINSSFLQIPKTYLDQVAATSGDISQYGAWVDCFLSYKVAQPLARYSVPSLQDPAAEHGDSVTVRKSGSRID